MPVKPTPRVPPPPTRWARPPVQAKPQASVPPPPTRWAPPSVQAKPAAPAPRPAARVPTGGVGPARPKPAATPVRLQPSPFRAAIQPMSESGGSGFVHVQLGANQSETHHIVPEARGDLPDSRKFEFLYEGSSGERKMRSFSRERPRQILRWIATALFAKLPNAVEIQCYWDRGRGELWISTNKLSQNKKIAATLSRLVDESIDFDKTVYSPGRVRRHVVKLLSRRERSQAQQPIYDALIAGNVRVPLERYPASTSVKQIDLHAERRIRRSLGSDLDPNYLAGVKRPCLICARALGLVGARPGPLWNSAPGLVGYDMEDVLDHAVANGTITHVTRDRYTGRLDTGHDTDSDSGEDE